MIDLLLSQEMLLRLVPFLGVFALMAVLEAWVPRRARGLPRSTRWPSNLGIVVVDTLVVRLLFPDKWVWALIHAVKDHYPAETPLSVMHVLNRYVAARRGPVLPAENGWPHPDVWDTVMCRADAGSRARLQMSLMHYMAEINAPGQPPGDHDAGPAPAESDSGSPTPETTIDKGE